MKTVDIDPQEFTKLYNEGVPYRQLAKKYGCGTTKIHSMRVALKLPVRGNMSRATSYHPKNVDEKRFRELYEAGLSYQQIGDDLGIQTVGTVARYIRVFGLPSRDRALLRIDKEKFTKMYMNGCSLRGLAREFRTNQKTTLRVISALDLPERKGKTKFEVVSKLPVIELEESDDSLDDSLYDNLDDFKKPCKFFCVPTLRELEKRNQRIEMIRAEQEYKNKWRKHDE